MNKHFNYLLDDTAGDFFQKAAEEQAADLLQAHPARPRPQAPMDKTASVNATSFDKFASRLERDIEIIKMAGTAGASLGTCKRALDYMERLADESWITDEQFTDAFDKVASAAIEADVDELRHDMVRSTPGVDQACFEPFLARVGLELVKWASMDKDAGILGSLARGAGKLFGGGRMLGGISEAGSVLKGGVGGVAKGIRDEYRAGRALGQAKKLEGLSSDIAKTRAKLIAPNLSPSTRGALEGSLGSLEKQHFKVQGDIGGAGPRAAAARQMGASVTGTRLGGGAKSPAASSATTASSKPTAATPVVAKVPETPSPKTPEVKTPKVPDGTPPSGVPASTEAALDEAAAAGPFSETAKKFWAGSKLTTAERNQLIKGGLMGVGGHRLLTGRDLLSGDKED